MVGISSHPESALCWVGWLPPSPARIASVPYLDIAPLPFNAMEAVVGGLRDCGVVGLSRRSRSEPGTGSVQLSLPLN